MWITPNHQNTDFNCPFSIDDKLTIFRNRTLGWQLKLANRVINGNSNSTGRPDSNAIQHSGYATLNIVLSYFEMIGKYKDGYLEKGNSGKYFKKGVYDVFPNLKNENNNNVEKLLNVLYSGGRCGLYHAGMTDKRVLLTGDITNAMTYDVTKDKLIINPHQLVPHLISHFQNYVNDLQNTSNTKLRQNFEKIFDHKLK